MKPLSSKQVQIVAWSVSVVTSLIAFYAWGDLYNWRFSRFFSYQLFPLFGLLAFSLMWSHYAASVVRQVFKVDKTVLKAYFEATSLAVLVFILLHPGLLAWQLWRDGLGLPPGSEISYVAGGLGGYVILGMISLLAFLVYELRRKYEERPWWKFVGYASDIAMLLIVIHSLKLGTHLQQGWLRGLWYFYALTLVAALIFNYFKKYQRHKA